MSILGFVDQISHHQVSGWAFDDGRPVEKLNIRVAVNGQEHGQCVANMDRPGLKDHLASATDDGHAFLYVFSPPLSTFRSVTIEVLEAVSNSQIPQGRKTLHTALSTRTAMTPLLVTSRGRTGTTLLLKWLFQRPDVVVANAYPYEIKLISYFASALKVLVTPKFAAGADDPDFVQHATATLQIGRNPWSSPTLLSELGGRELQRLLAEFRTRSIGGVVP